MEALATSWGSLAAAQDTSEAPLGSLPKFLPALARSETTLLGTDCR